MFFVRALAILPEACNRTRQHVSLRLDRQLSELERAEYVAMKRRESARMKEAL